MLSLLPLTGILLVGVALAKGVQKSPNVDFKCRYFRSFVGRIRIADVLIESGVGVRSATTFPILPEAFTQYF